MAAHSLRRDCYRIGGFPPVLSRSASRARTGNRILGDYRFPTVKVNACTTTCLVLPLPNVAVKVTG